MCNRGCGSALMTKSNRLFEILDAMSAQLPSRSVTIKIRTGWNEKAPIAHELIPQIQTRFNNKLSAIMVSLAVFLSFFSLSWCVSDWENVAFLNHMMAFLP